MPTRHLPPGAGSLVEDDHPSHPILIDDEDGSRTRAKSISWSEYPAPAGTFTIQDGRDVDAHGAPSGSDEDDPAA